MLNTDEFPRPHDPTPRWDRTCVELADGEKVRVLDDVYSDRIRCDHPSCEDGAGLGQALLDLAVANGRTRVVAFAPARLQAALENGGLRLEALIPGFYDGDEDCAVLGRALKVERVMSMDAPAVARVERLIQEGGRGRRTDGNSQGSGSTPLETRRATVDDAAGIASLVTLAFQYYPTPTGVPAYVQKQIRDGVPFRVACDRGEVVACASADLLRDARTAELTDCVTQPRHGGQGLMQTLLEQLMDDLREFGYPTAFSLVRAKVPGINLAFQRLGFVWRGQMISSCRIGDGIEDINVWSRPL